MKCNMKQFRARSAWSKRVGGALRHAAIERRCDEVASNDATEFLGEPQFGLEENYDVLIAEELGEI